MGLWCWGLPLSALLLCDPWGVGLLLMDQDGLLPHSSQWEGAKHFPFLCTQELDFAYITSLTPHQPELGYVAT